MKVSNFKLGIGIPLSFTHIPSYFFNSFIVMEKPEFFYITQNIGPIDNMRNEIVKEAMASGCTKLIMMDTDMVYHPQTITRLLAHKLPIVGALCFRRYPPFDPLIFRGNVNDLRPIEEWEKDSLIEVDVTGTGCLMIDMKVFNDLPYPWFRFRPNPDPKNGGVVGEDFGFCLDARKAGYQIFVDTSITAGHLGFLEVQEGTWQMYKLMKIGGK